MERSPALLLCGFACRPDLRDVLGVMQGLAGRLRDSGAFRQVQVVPAMCRDHFKELSGLQGTRILFGGCSMPAAEDFCARAARALSLMRGEAVSVDLLGDVLLRYDPGPGLEENLAARLLAAARLLEHAEGVPVEVLEAGGGALVYGSGLSGLQAALKLADAGVSVDLLPTPEAALSPGCLRLLLEARRPLERLRERLEALGSVRLLAAGAEKTLSARAGGFDLGGGRRYGCLVFAPERMEAEPAAAGSLNLTRLYARLAEGERIAGCCVLLFDHEQATDPEIFRDGLAAALAIREAGRARVYVLSRNVQVSFPGLEQLYAACREAGVLFLKYREPLVIDNDNGNFVLAGRDAQSGRVFTIPEPDVLAISRPGRLSPRALSFAGRLGLRLEGDACTRPDSLWSLGSETSRPGVFACGAARGHMDARGVEQDAESLAGKVWRRLRPGAMAVPEALAVVDGEKCAFCLTCVRLCPAGAMGRNREERRAEVDPGACQGCGLCAAACPAQAVQLRNLSAEALSAGIEALR